MVKMSKKGQGLALISILVLIAILYFVFRYNTDTYGFIMNTGDEQAHLVTAYTESAKARSFIQLSARQAAFETIWNLSSKGTDASALAHCGDADFQSEFKSLFDIYSAMYAPATDLISTHIPDYNFSFTCPSDNLNIEGWGYAERCTLSNTFPFPQYPCEDQANATSCAAIKFTQNYPGNACKWAADLNCTDSLPEPDCSGQDNSDTCNNINYCGWQVSNSEPISIVSAPLINYQFSIDSDAHFIENITGSEYEKFAKARVLAFPPSCSITVPATMISNAQFNISVKYTDDGAPNSIKLTVTHSFVQDVIDKSMSESDTNDKVYDNGKNYYYTATLANNTYVAEVTCIDSDGNKVTAQKDFKVSSV
ncbi:MAG: hypothetical protein NTY99_00420 [DPANN group archaeon]|nr:hypothetical protein [DPANN group archaeon]